MNSPSQSLKRQHYGEHRHLPPFLQAIKDDLIARRVTAITNYYAIASVGDALGELGAVMLRKE